VSKQINLIELQIISCLNFPDGNYEHKTINQAKPVGHATFIILIVPVLNYLHTTCTRISSNWICVQS